MKAKKIRAVVGKKAEILLIKTQVIALDSALKLSGIAGTGGTAKIMIQSGDVKVNGEICEKRSKKLKSGDIFSFENKRFEVRTHEGE
ncbi:MAG: RNA-binding S4 domain-containing protein [Oscillospiraceae bacterium]|jgi:ribosome-associated protein|nr:RNA-binding S4 domain-containing protein [Oscillospiraceae bacterium]